MRERRCLHACRYVGWTCACMAGPKQVECCTGKTMWSITFIRATLSYRCVVRDSADLWLDQVFTRPRFALLQALGLKVQAHQVVVTLLHTVVTCPNPWQPNGVMDGAPTLRPNAFPAGDSRPQIVREYYYTWILLLLYINCIILNSCEFCNRLTFHSMSAWI